MKLVVSYSHGEYEDYYKESLCVEHESKETWLAAFVKAFYVWAEKHKESNRLFDAMMTAYEGADEAAQELHEQAYNTYQENNETWSIVVDGRNFSSFEDWEDDADTYRITKLPQVYTLDEWFEENRARKVE